MKKKEKFKFIIIGVLIAVVSGAIGVTAATKLYDSDQVGYDNSESGIEATDVQGAIDELYAAATDYTTLENAIASLETAVTNLQTQVNNMGNDYSQDVYTTTYGPKVIAEKRNGVVTISVRGTTTSEIDINGKTATLVTLPEKYRPMGVDGNSSKIFYITVRQRALQFYVTPAGNVILGYCYNNQTNSNEVYPTNAGLWGTVSYVTNR